MKREWGGHRRRAPRQRQEMRFQTIVQGIPLRGRLDVVLTAGLICVLAVAAAIAYLSIEFADRAGWLSPQLVEPIEDNRILMNVRDDIAEKPLLDAVWHGPDGKVVIAQTGGAFHSYDPATRLWYTERPFTSSDAINSDFTLLRSGCGEHPLSEHGRQCSDPNSLWAVSVDGGLAHKLNGRWSIVVADSAFLGADGKPVNQDELTAAAVSSNGSWLVVGTMGKGIGLYDLKQHRWHPVPGDVQGALPALSVSHVVWSDGAFWVGSAQGVAKLAIRGNLPVVESGPFPTLDVVDMDANEDGLWVLGRRPCSEVGAGCLWLGYLLEGSSVPHEVMVEQAVYPELNADELFFAQMWGEDLVVAGPAGIFQYSPVLHSWRQLFVPAVETVLPASGRQGFYFGYSGGAGLAAPDSESPLKVWPLENEVVVHVALLREQDPLALTASGKAIALRSDGTTSPVFTPEVTQLNPDLFHAAVAVGNRLAFMSNEGVLIHDVALRTYQDLDAAGLPRWVTAPDTRYVVSGNTLFAVAKPAQSKASIYRMELAKIADADYLLNDAANLTAEIVPGPVRKLWAWGANVLGILDGKGSIEQLGQNSAAQLLTGPRQSDLNLDDFKDAIELNDDVIFATGDGLRRYDSQQRTWSSLPMPADYGGSAELAAFGGVLYVRTANGQLIRPDQNPAPVIGDNRAFSISPEELSDALIRNGMLYHAGDGRVERYNLALRRIDKTWKLNGADPVALVAIAEDKPLTLNGRRAYWGEQAIDIAAGDVLGLSIADASIWTVREIDGTRYLKGYPLADPSADAASCFFRQPAAGPGVTTIHDAVRLPNGWIAAASDSGLLFYSLEQRSWHGIRTDVVKPDRLYLTSRHLVLVRDGTDDNSAAAFVPLDSMRFPSSCDKSSVDFQHTSIQARAVAVDSDLGVAAWILEDGSVYEWKNGQTRLMLAASGQGPSASSLRRIFQRDEYLLTAAEGSLWRYTLESHEWKTIQLGLASEAITDINAEPAANGDMLTVSVGDNFYTGLLSANADSVSLVAATVGDRNRPFGADSAHILDIQNRSDSVWTFVLTDRIKYLDPVRRTWRADAPLGTADPSLQLHQTLGRAVAVGDNGQIWWIAQQTGAAPQRFVRFALRPASQHALDAQGNVWVLDGEGQLQKCQPQGDQLICASAAPAPFYLERDRVRQAYLWGDYVVFVAEDGLRAFDTLAKGAVALPPEAAAFRGVHQVQIPDRELWLLGDQGLMILRRDQNSVAAQFVDGVSTVVADGAGQVWARFPDGWRRQQGSDFVSPTLTDGRTLSEAGVRLLVAEGSRPMGYDGAGYTYTLVDGSFVQSELPLPQRLAGRTLTAVSTGEKNELWVIADDGQWHHVVRSRCAPAVPTPLPTEQGTPTLEPLGIADTISQPISPIQPLTATSLLAPTPTLTPTPAPEPLPCMLDVYYQPLPDDFTLGLAGEPAGVSYAAGRGLELINSAGKALRIISRPTYTATVYEAPALPRRAEDRWQELQSNLGVLASGRTAYAPIMRLVVQNGALVADRPGYAHQLVSPASLTLELPPALDAGWIRWNRSQMAATVSTPGGDVSVAARHLASDGHLFFEGIKGVVAGASGRVFAATQGAICSYPTPDLRLDSRDIQVAFSTILPPVQVAHGRFYAANGVFRSDGSQDTNAPAVWTVRLGSITLNETITSRSVTGSLPIGAQVVSPFAEYGFLWDASRNSLAYDKGSLVLLTPAGIHAIDDFRAFDPGPSTVQRGEGQLLADTNRQLFLAAGDPAVFYARSIGWQSQSINPNDNRSIFSDASWTWRIRQGALDVSLANDSHQFRISTINGFGFTSDQLQFAAAHAGNVFVMSQAFLEIAVGSGELAELSAERFAPVATDRLDEVPYVNAPAQLYRRLGATITRWDSANRRFTAVTSADNPFARLVRVDDNRLRYTQLGDHVRMELRVDGIGGAAQWVEMTLQDGRFPFDVVTGVSVHQGQLYVGSAAGLQIFDSGRNLAIRDASTVLDMRSGSWLPLAAVDRLGTPMIRPDLIHVWAGTRCVQRQNQGAFTNCIEPDLLDRRLRIKTAYWEWETDKTATLAGNYLSVMNTRLPVTLQDGRLGHDNIGDAIACAGQSLTLWEDHWLMVYTGGSLALNSTVRTFDRSIDGVSGLLCVPDSFRTDAATVEAGLYLRGRAGSYWRYSGSDWTSMGDKAVNVALADFAARPPIYMRGRMRLVKPSAGDQYIMEQRQINLSWLPLQWISNPIQGGFQISIDQWTSFVWNSDQLWVGSPAGVAAFQQGGDSPLQIDPQLLHVITIPNEVNGSCRISDMEVIEGKFMLRCDADSHKVLEGTLSLDRDTAVFSLNTGTDPFAERTWVSQGPDHWSVWQLKGRHDGAAGRLEGQLCLTAASGSSTSNSGCQEAITLGGGRFQFDTVNSLALFGDQMLIATDAGGWLAYPRLDLHLRSVSRPAYAAVDSLAVNHVGYTLGPEDDLRLCVAQKGSGFTTLSGDGRHDQPTSCPEYAGSDSLWHYSVNENLLEINAGTSSEGGSGVRQLVRGRFTDDLLVGPPAAGSGAAPIYYLPTAAGTLELDQDLNSSTIHVGAFPGLREQEVPTAIYLWDGVTPTYLAQDGFHSLSESRETIHTVAMQHERQEQPRSLEDGPQKSVLVTWPRLYDAWNEWNLVATVAGVQPVTNEFQIYVGETKAYRRYGATWGSPSPWMTVSLSPTTVEVAGPSRSSVKAAIDPGFVLVTAVPTRNSLLLIGTTDLLTLDLNQLTARAFQAPELPTPVPTVAPHIKSMLTLEPQEVTPLLSPTKAALPIATPTPVITSTTAEATIAATLPPPTAISLPTPTATSVAIVTSLGLNVRKGPGVDYDILTIVKQNAPLRILGTWYAGGWLMIETQDGQKGWIASNYTEMEGCTECIPVLTENDIAAD